MRRPSKSARAQPKPSPFDAATAVLRLPTGPASIVDEGARPAVVHGLVLDVRWLTPHRVPARRRAVRGEMPGFGGTPVGPDPPAEGRAALVAVVIAALGPAVVLGPGMVSVVATGVALVRRQPPAAAGRRASPSS
jgi:hypothetical protein